MSDPAALARTKKSRAGHRASASKTISKVEEELLNSPKPSQQKLKQYQQTLQLKQQTLDGLNEIIMEHVEEDSLEEEIDGIDGVREKIGLSLLAIEDALSQLEEARLSTIAPIERAAESAPHTVPVIASTRSADLTATARLPSTDATPTLGVSSRAGVPAPPDGIHTGTTPISISTSVPATTDGARLPAAPRIKLPKLVLQKFNGDISQWTPFWNQFDSSINSNPTLHDIDKFNYLVSYLEGEAAESIRGMAVTTANYSAAVARLQERFGDNQRIIDKHMEALLHLPHVRSHLDLQGLRRLSDTLAANISGLRALGEKEESYSKVVSPVIMSRLPTELQLSIGKELEAGTRDMTRLTAAINREIAARERYVDAAKRNNRSPTPPRRPHPTTATFTVNQQNQCPFCGKGHQATACTKFPSPSARGNLLKKQGKCFNCFRKGHLSRQCRATDRCSKCRGKHHTAVCRGESSKPQAPPTRGQGDARPADATPTRDEATPTREGATPTNCLYVGDPSSVLMQTAQMRIFNPNTSPRGARRVGTILDTGSHRTYLSKQMAEELQLQAHKSVKFRMQTFGRVAEEETDCPVVELAITTQKNGPLRIEALVVPFITEPVASQPPKTVSKLHPHLKGLYLADYHRAEEHLHIDLLIGSDWYWSLVTGHTRRGKEGPIAIHTKVGWVLSGPTEDTGSQESTNLLVRSTHILRIHTTPVEESLDHQLQKFWDLEIMGVAEQEPSVQESFTQSIRQVEGRYEVQLPWKPTHKPLPTNLHLCKKRLQSLLNKLKPQPELLQEYNKVIQEQLQRGIVEVVSEEQHQQEDKIHYLPHHPVVRKDKTTTKLRVVYDASSKSQDHPSLNDCLYAGPSFEQSILDILLRFRTYPIAMAADVEKAFLMISIAPEDRNALRFLWPADITEDPPNIQTLRFTRVVFGVTCSPFLLNATVRHHVQKYQKEDPAFVKTVLDSIYVDDVTFGAEDEEAAYQLFTKTRLRLAEAHFNLRKFRSNSTSLQHQIDTQEDPQLKKPVLTTTSEEDQSYAKTTLGVKGEEDGREEQKILGVRWNYREDRLSLGTEELAQQLEKQTTPTKREVVAAAAKIFDPLGLMSPTTVLWKMLFQATCKANLQWDEPLSGELLKEWGRLKTAVGEKVEFDVPRCYQSDGEQPNRLIGFCDASERAYSAVVYLRIGGKEAKIRFVASKTRVAPTKTLTIPRLELMSALLLSRLCHTLQEALKNTMKLEKTVCYTDSKVSLCWIQGEESEWKTFVENRVTAIRKIIPACNWKHCPGLQNPADIPSRGMLPQKLKEEKRWLEGPEWLKRTLEPSILKGEEVPEECLREKKRRIHILLTPQQQKRGVSQLINIEGYSNIRRLLRVTATVLKFTNLARGRRKKTLDLLQEARLLWIREAQEEITDEKGLKNSHHQLGMRKDEEGLWRCHGRMENAQLEAAAKKPILIDRKHHLATLLIREAHEKVLHSGCKATLTELRSRYWIVKGRQAVRREIHHCPTCRRMEGPAFRSLPPPALPAFRVQQSRPFLSIGLDYAGPLYVKGSGEEEKVWICLYTCCTTRAVHLDLVQGLSAEAFIRSLRRFCSRRGVPARIVSDNALTFKAADQELQAILKDPQTQAHMEGQQIEWKFITEKAPWQGGVYERMVKSTKRCLKKTVGRKSLTHDELLTLVTEVEAVLNSRPISYVSSEDTEEPLTPSHLITGHRILSLPDTTVVGEEEDPGYEPTRSHLTRRMSHLAVLKERFWRRWRQEYLQELREHHLRQSAKPGLSRELQVDEPVVIYDEDHPRGLWRLGRIQELIRSTDGAVRAARVVVVSGNGKKTTLKRPIQHLHPLEVREGTAPEVPQAEQDTPAEMPAEEAGREPSDQTIDVPDPDVQDREDQEPVQKTQRRRPGRAAAQQARENIRDLAGQDLI